MNSENLKNDNNIKKTFKLTITSGEIVSNDKRFTMDDLSLGKNYIPLEVYFENAKGKKTYRNKTKNERKISTHTLPRLAFQIYEKELIDLSQEEKAKFPICQYSPSKKIIIGIYSSVKEFKKYRNSQEHLSYTCKDGQTLVIYIWNIFSTIKFVQECLKRFGNDGDKFVLEYEEKNKQNTNLEEKETKLLFQQNNAYKNPYSNMLIESKNLIFRGAPGTGKSYLAKEIAADIISNGHESNFSNLTEEQKRQVEFVQFHPSYDYSDFVEGLRPKINNDGTMSFELKDGIFKEFVDCARKNLENSRKLKDTTKAKKYIFIIDEINRGEISKIFGELFFAIDPGYRGKAGEISTQYSNLHSNPNEKFYIPENVYIIGTMNDIDRSVDSFDFAMRRRFRFIELKANEQIKMLDLLENEELKNEAIKRMSALNKAIINVEDLNENYQIGAAYFLKLKNLTFDQLWIDFLQPLLHEYVQGMFNEKEIMDRFAEEYGFSK